MEGADRREDPSSVVCLDFIEITGFAWAGACLDVLTRRRSAARHLSFAHSRRNGTLPGANGLARTPAPQAFEAAAWALAWIHLD